MDEVQQVGDTELQTNCDLHDMGLRLSKVPSEAVQYVCSRYHTALNVTKKHADRSSGKWSDVVEVWQCKFPGCTHYLCLECGNERISLNAKLLNQAVGMMPFLIVILALLLYIPVVKTTTMIILCHPIYQCAFTSCYQQPDAFFSVAVAGSFAILIFVGILMPLVMLFAAYRRRELLRGDIDIKSSWERLASWWRSGYMFRWITGKTKEKDAALRHVRRRSVEFQYFISLSESMGLSTMTKIYVMFRPGFMVIGPILQQTVKLGVTLCCVLLEVNSTEQLAATGTIEILNCIFIVMCNPFSSKGIQRVSSFGSMHQVGIICLSAFYRVALFDENETAQLAFGILMFTFSFAFILLVLFTLYQLGVHEAVVTKIKTAWKAMKPNQYNICPSNSTASFYVGKRTTTCLEGYLVNHGQRVRNTATDTYGTIVGTDKPKGTLFWGPDSEKGTWVPAAKDKEEFAASFETLHVCESIEGTYSRYVSPEEQKKNSRKSNEPF